MKSVLILMAAKEITQYIHWSEKSCELTDENIERWAAATILNVTNPNEMVSLFCYHLSMLKTGLVCDHILILFR